MVYKQTDKETVVETLLPRLTQPPTLCGTGNKYRPKCGDALWLGIKTEWLIPFVDKLWVAEIKLCDPLTRSHPERFRNEFYN